ncbi:hypothetical protein C8R43DRAFT_960434 [Mycena crocata]|nr:hypothetical protein C8R43DRAFT_960434 [Mycena crocata]
MDHTVDDLDIDEWLEERQQAVVNQSLFSSEVSVSDLTGVRPPQALVRSKYVLLTCPHDESDDLERNVLLALHLGVVFTQGNILVVGLDDISGCVASLQTSEIPVTDSVVKWFVENKAGTGTDSVFEHCTVGSLVSLSVCGHRQQALVHRFILWRIRRNLSHFLDHEQQTMVFNCMRLHGGGITGSVATSTLMFDTLLSPRDMPSNLNFTVPKAAAGAWLLMMQSFMLKEERPTTRNVRARFVRGIHRVYVFSVRNPKVCC